MILSPSPMWMQLLCVHSLDGMVAELFSNLVEDFNGFSSLSHASIVYKMNCLMFDSVSLPCSRKRADMDGRRGLYRI